MRLPLHLSTRIGPQRPPERSHAAPEERQAGRTIPPLAKGSGLNRRARSTRCDARLGSDRGIASTLTWTHPLHQRAFRPMLLTSIILKRLQPDAMGRRLDRSPTRAKAPRSRAIAAMPEEASISGAEIVCPLLPLCCRCCRCVAVVAVVAVVCRCCRCRCRCCRYCRRCFLQMPAWQPRGRGRGRGRGRYR